MLWPLSAEWMVSRLEIPGFDSRSKRISRSVSVTADLIRFDLESKPGISNLLTIHSALSGQSIPDLEAAYAGKGYGDLKKDLADVVVGALAPLRERVLGYLDSPGTLDDILSLIHISEPTRLGMISY